MTTDTRFDFQRDTLAFANETKWQYAVDPATGQETTTPRVPAPDYCLRCFTLVHAVRQFWRHAAFDPTRPASTREEFRRSIRRVLSGTSTVKGDSRGSRVMLPGFASLREFSRAQEALLKAECGGAWRSYFQRGNWRMVFPFSRLHQLAEATRLIAKIHRGELPIVHLVRFPQLTINHAVLLLSARESQTTITFDAYDPNLPAQPVTLEFNRSARTFSWPPLFYFAGGRVEVYEVYRNWIF